MAGATIIIIIVRNEKTCEPARYFRETLQRTRAPKKSKITTFWREKCGATARANTSNRKVKHGKLTWKILAAADALADALAAAWSTAGTARPAALAAALAAAAIAALALAALAALALAAAALAIA